MALLIESITNNVTAVPSDYWLKVSRLLNTGPGTFYNVRNPDYGAVGNGTTNDTTAIQAAITACQNAGGGIVYLPPGTYSVVGLVVSASNVAIVGSGWGSVLKLANATNAYVITFQATTGDYRNVRLLDFKIDANGSTQTADSGGINANAAVQCNFERLYIQNPWQCGLRLGNSSGGGFGHHNRVISCLMDSSGTFGGSGYGLDLFATDENFIAFNDFESLGGSGTEPAHIIDRAGLNKFFGNNFVGGRNNARGIRFKDCHRSQVIGGTFDGVAGDNISIDGSSFRIAEVTFGSIGDQGTVAASAVLFNNDAVRNQVVNCFYQSSGTASKTRSYIRETGVGATPNNRILGGAIETVGALSVGPFEIATGSLTRVAGVMGYNPVGGAVTTPAVPSSGVAVTNTTGVDVVVFVNGGTVSAISIGGTATGITATNRDFRLAAGQTITLTYSVAPTWKWFGD